MPGPSGLRIASRASPTPWPRWRDGTGAADAGRKPIALLLLAVVVVAAIGAAYLGPAASSAEAPRASPPSPCCPSPTPAKDPDKEYLSDGISESLIRRLSQLAGREGHREQLLRPSTRAKTPTRRRWRAPWACAGVVTGKVLQRGADLSISVELIDTRTRRRCGASSTAGRRPTSSPCRRRSPARSPSSSGYASPPGQQQALATKESASPQAYELLLKGRFHRSRGASDDRKQAGDYFSQAIAVDPAYAPAYADLADIYRSLVGSSIYDPKEYLPKAETAARKAIDLDPGNADAYFTSPTSRRAPGSGPRRSGTSSARSS